MFKKNDVLKATVSTEDVKKGDIALVHKGGKTVTLYMDLDVETGQMMQWKLPQEAVAKLYEKTTFESVLPILNEIDFSGLKSYPVGHDGESIIQGYITYNGQKINTKEDTWGGETQYDNIELVHEIQDKLKEQLQAYDPDMPRIDLHSHIDCVVSWGFNVRPLADYIAVCRDTNNRLDGGPVPVKQRHR